MFSWTRPGSKFLLAVLDGPAAVGDIKEAFDKDKHLLFQNIVDSSVIQDAGVVLLVGTQSTFAPNPYQAIQSPYLLADLARTKVSLFMVGIVF
jgi:hypothetical protein